MNPSGGRSRDVAARRSIDRILLDLRDRVRRRAPELAVRGPEDPGWVLLEAFAEVLSEVEGDAELLEERIFPRVLESLGDEPRWTAAAAAPVVFVPADGADDPVPVPRGTAVGAPRRDGEAHLGFETVHDAWSSTARLVRAVACGGEAEKEIFPYPQAGWDSEPVALFARRVAVDRHLYLGDPALVHLRDRPGALVLEWPGDPQVLWEGRWEYSVQGGWRAVEVELEVAGALTGRAGQRRAVTLRIAGPLLDLAERRIESASFSWLRVSLEGGRRTSLAQPTWIRAEPAAPSLAFPRPVSRVLSRGGERWEDHSLTAQKIVPVESPEASDPAVYLGWDRPVPASVYFALQGRPAPPGWGGLEGRRSPGIVWEHSSGRGFRALEAADGTRGLARSGCVTWGLPHEWTPQEHFGERLHWVRARWVSGAYFSPPVLRALLPHAAEARQHRTVPGRVLDVLLDRRGRGPIPLLLAEGEPERFGAIEVREAGGDWRRLVARGTGEPHACDAPREPAAHGAEREPAAQGVKRESADPRSGEGPAGVEPGVAREDGRFAATRLPRGGYVLDVGSRWTGSVAVKIPLLRLALGSCGNVPAGTLTVLESQVPGIRKAVQPLPADGGQDPEGPEAFRKRVRAEWKTGDRAVTADDFRRLTLAFDPSIARVETAPSPVGGGRVMVCVVPAEPGATNRLSPARLDWLAETLEAKAPLGTVVEVVEPMYVPVEVVVRVHEDAPPPSESVRRRAEEHLRRFCDPLVGGPDGQGFPAGRWLNAVDVRSIMSRVFRGGDAGPRAGDPGISRLEIRGPGGRPLPAGLEEGSAVAACPLVIPVVERLAFESQERPSS